MSAPTLRYKQNRLQQLRGFCYAARTKSISKAADMLFLSQPSVSLQIKALEEELGAKLFERKGPRIALTHDGETLYDLARPIVGAIDKLDEEFFARRDSLEHGTVSIAAGGSTIQYVLPPVVEQFLGEYPDIDVRLHNVTGKAGLELMREGDADFAVGPLLDTPDDLAFYAIVSYDPVLITAPSHPLAARKRIRLRDISQYPLILPPKHLSTWRMLEYVFAEHGLPYEVKLEVGGYEVIKTYVRLGLGISIVMDICITGKEDLHVAPVGKYFPKRTYGLVLRKGRPISRPAQKFIETMRPDLAGMEMAE